MFELASSCKYFARANIGHDGSCALLEGRREEGALRPLNNGISCRLLRNVTDKEPPMGHTRDPRIVNYRVNIDEKRRYRSLWYIFYSIDSILSRKFRCFRLLKR